MIDGIHHSLFDSLIWIVVEAEGFGLIRDLDNHLLDVHLFDEGQGLPQLIVNRSVECTLPHVCSSLIPHIDDLGPGSAEVVFRMRGEHHEADVDGFDHLI